jgi:3-hydroxybutyryl-CoA dehydrogenase
MPDTTPEQPPIKQAAIIGFGTVSPGIALSWALKGINVRVHDVLPDAYDKGMEVIRTSLEVMVDKGLVKETEVPEVLARITPIGHLDGNRELTQESLEGVDFILEAVKEDKKAKAEFFKKLDAVAPKDTIIATNTSAFDVTELADFLSEERWEKFIGYHVAHPAHISTAVEIIEGPASPETVEKVDSLLAFIGKDPIHVKGEPAVSAWNRVQCAVVATVLDLIKKGNVLPGEAGRMLTGALGMRWAAIDPVAAVIRGNPMTHYAYMNEMIRHLPNAVDMHELINYFLRDRHPPFTPPAEGTAPAREDVLAGQKAAESNLFNVMMAQPREVPLTVAVPDFSAILDADRAMRRPPAGRA